jgi:hypothetical protein
MQRPLCSKGYGVNAECGIVGPIDENIWTRFWGQGIEVIRDREIGMSFSIASCSSPDSSWTVEI